MRRRSFPWSWLIVPLLLCCTTEAQSTPRTKAPQAAGAKAPVAPATVSFVPVGAPAIRVKVEVVSTPEARQRGLMFRKHLDPDAGMLFIFEAPQQLTFWMHNTYLPLDMIFVKADMTILGVVENATPLTDDPRSVPGASQYVVEVNAGFARKHGLRAGTKLTFENLPKTS